MNLQGWMRYLQLWGVKVCREFTILMSSIQITEELRILKSAAPEVICSSTCPYHKMQPIPTQTASAYDRLDTTLKGQGEVGFTCTGNVSWH